MTRLRGEGATLTIGGVEIPLRDVQYEDVTRKTTGPSPGPFRGKTTIGGTMIFDGVTKFRDGGRNAARLLAVIDAAIVAEYGPHIISTEPPDGVRACFVVHTCADFRALGTLLVRVRRGGRSAAAEFPLSPEWWETAGEKEASDVAERVILACSEAMR